MPHPLIEPGHEAEAAFEATLAILDADKAEAIDYAKLIRHMLRGKAVRTADLVSPRELRARIVAGVAAAAHLLEADPDSGVELVAFEVSHGQVTDGAGVGYAVFLGIGTAHGLEVQTHITDPDDAREMARALLLNAIELDLHNAGATRCHGEDEPAPPVLADEDRDLAVKWLRDRAQLAELAEDYPATAAAVVAELRAVADLIGTNAHRTPLR